MKPAVAFALFAAATAQISNEYLPPNAGGSDGGAGFGVGAYSPPAPAVSYSAPAATYEAYEVDASAPAHSFSDADGYRYKTQRHRVVKTARRNRRDVSSEYLPPVASHSFPEASYSAPVASYSAPAASYSAPVASYTAPAAAVESYDVGASAPAHSFSDSDGYRYKAQRRVVVRRNRF